MRVDGCRVAERQWQDDRDLFGQTGHAHYPVPHMIMQLVVWLVAAREVVHEKRVVTRSAAALNDLRLDFSWNDHRCKNGNVSLLCSF